MKRVEELGISPQPWEADDNGCVSWVETDDDCEETDYEVCDCWGGNATANARLIAAAPDMYNALQFVFDHIAFQCFDGKNEVIEKAKELVRTALEKASGEEVYIG